MELKVYYGITKDVWVFIDGKKMTTEQATNELLIKGKIRVSQLDKNKNIPAGLFSSTGDFYIVDASSKQKSGEVPLLYGERGYVAPIDYGNITPENLKLHLENRFAELKEYIKKVDKIECLREIPPD